MPCEETFSITQVSEITGVNSVTLRAWQRRYGLLKPLRNEKGHRFYTVNDIELIKDILSWLDKGVSIGKVKSLLDAPLINDADEQTLDEFSDLAEALNQLSRDKISALFSEIMKNYPFEIYYSKLILPVRSLLNAADNPLGNIQLSLWQGVITEKCVEIIARQRQRNKSKAFLLCFDDAIDLVWLHALSFTNQGYKVIVLPNLQGGLAPLGSLISQDEDALLALVGDKRIPSATVKSLLTIIKRCDQKVRLLDDIGRMHRDDFVGNLE